jgi:Zn-dependent peptidase ImmA (M78 family)
MPVPRSRINELRLEAVTAAKRLHRQLGLEKRVREQNGAIDVFASIVELGIPLVFKPLENALGLCLPRPVLGIMVTTKRTLNIQRFTAAHELGHAILQHGAIVDREILERGPMGPDNGRDSNEVAAESFAAEFLLPRWLYRMHATKQGWGVNHLKNPDVIYQLSLRMGASYEATCWGLLSNQILNRADVNILRKEKVASTKKKLGEGHRPQDSWADIWRVTDRDDGALLSATEKDLVQVELPEHGSGGFEWNADTLRDAGLEVLYDESEFDREPLRYGTPSIRKIVARPTGAIRRRLDLVERQPWDGQAVEGHLSITVAFDGTERGGMSRFERARRGLVES